MNTLINQNEINVGVDTGKKFLDIYIHPLDIFFTVENNQKGIKEGFIHYLDHKERRQIPLNPFLKEEIKELIKKVEILLNKKELPGIVENPNKCTNCGLKDQCSNEKLLNTKLNENFKY